MDRSTNHWVRVGGVDPARLVDARLEVHWAVQLLAAFGQTFVSSRPDDSHRSATFDRTRGVLRSEEAADASRLRLSLRPTDLRLGIMRAGAPTSRGFALGGHTLDMAHEWVAGQVAEIRGTERIPLERPEFEIPIHPVGREGRPFSSGLGDSLAELERWFSNAAAVLWRMAARLRNATPVRCWPHHLDMATLCTHDEGDDERPTRTIGVGLSPGDESYAEPYWYVTPYPYPDTAALPELTHGHWHARGWVGAVLSGTRVAAEEAQDRLVAAFLDDAVKACRELHARAQGL